MRTYGILQSTIINTIKGDFIHDKQTEVYIILEPD